MSPMILMNFRKWLLIAGVLAFPALSRSDVYVNVMAVNGAPERKETSVRYNLPGDVMVEDVLDANGLELEYDASNANYYVHGMVALEPKESKTFRVRLRDIWKLTNDQVAKIKDDIAKGYDQIGKNTDPEKADALRQQLLDKLDFIAAQQTTRAESIEQRMSAYRAYSNEMQRIVDKAMAVDYWRSEPGEIEEKILNLKIEVTNPKSNTKSEVTYKSYLPAEVQPKDVKDADAFEVRYDPRVKQAFLYKEENIAPGETKSYVIGIVDTWYVPASETDYLRKRSDKAFGFLKDTKYESSAAVLHDSIEEKLKAIEESQKKDLSIEDHISLYKDNQLNLVHARNYVENLEKILALYREELEKSKIKNVLQKIRSLKGVSDMSQQILGKKPTPANTWSFIGYIAIFLAALTVIYFISLLIRSSMRPKEVLTKPEVGEQKSTAADQAKKDKGQ